MEIEHTKSLIKAFQYRTLTHHAKPHLLEHYQRDSDNVYLIFDPSFSKKILISRAFISFNYFQPGLDRASENNRPLKWMQSYFDSSLLFMNGEEHRLDKKTLIQLTNQLETLLLEWQPRLDMYFYKRRHSINSAIELSQKITRICLGIIISRLLSISLRRVLKCIDIRENIWFVWFHPSRQVAMDKALEYLYQGEELSSDRSDPAYFSHQLVQSLIVMGYDPLVGSMCASMSYKEKTCFASDSYRICPTSFVSRVCKEPIQINGLDFKTGDICFTSLVPGADQAENESSSKSLAYGSGPHICIGKSLSLTILKMAQSIHEKHFSSGFKHNSAISPDGAFLSFRDEASAL